MANIVNRVWVNTATTGTGTVTLGSATTNYQTPTAAGMINGASYDYLILDGTTAWEVGTGVYTVSGLTLTRPGPGVDANFSSSTNALISLSGSATIAVVANQNTLAQKITGSGAPGSLSYPFGTIYIDSTNNAAYVSLSAGVAPGVVQAAPINAATNPSGTLAVTFPSAPTVGNTMVTLYTAFSGGTVGGGWTSLGSQGESNDNLFAAYRVVQAGDTAAQTVATGAVFGVGICAAWELSGVLTPPFLDAFAGVQNASATTSSQTLSATATANEIALVLSEAYSFAGTVTPDATWTTDSTFSAAANSRPAWSGHKLFPTAGVAPTQTTTFSSAAVGESVMVSLKASTPGAVWLRLHSVNVQASGVALGVAATLNFTGAGVSTSFAAGTATVTIAGGGGGSSPSNLIAKHTFGTGETSYTFSGIPATFEDLEFVFVGESTNATAVNATVTINGLSTAIYDQQRAYWSNSSGGSSSTDNTQGGTSWAALASPGSSTGGANTASFIRLRFFDYQNTSYFKMAESFGRQQIDAVPGGAFLVIGAHQARTTAAVTSITITMPSGAFTAGSTVSLLGIGGTGTSGVTPGGAWTALTFGAAVSINGGSRYPSNQTFTLSAGQKLEVRGEVHKLSSGNATILVNKDGTNSYEMAAQSDGNWVFYKWNGTSPTAFTASGTGSVDNFTGSYEVDLSVVVNGTSNNNTRAGVEGYQTFFFNDTSADFNGTVTVYISTDDTTKCNLAARVV